MSFTQQTAMQLATLAQAPTEAFEENSLYEEDFLAFKEVHGKGVKPFFFIAKVPAATTVASAASGETFGKTMVAREHIALNIVGDPRTVPCHLVNDRFKRMWPAEYDKWKNGEQNEIASGTPLYELPNVPASLIAMFMVNNISTVEELAGMDRDSVIQAVGGDHLPVWEKATNWMNDLSENEAKNQLAQVASDAKESNDQAMAMIENMNQKLQQLENENAALRSVQHTAQVQQPAEVVGVGTGDMSHLPDDPTSVDTDMDGNGVYDPTSVIPDDPQET